MKTINWRTLFRYSLFLGIFFFISGCSSVLFSGASAVYDQYHWKARIKNEKICLEIISQFKSDPRFSKENSRISVTCFDYKVLLTGQTINMEFSKAAADIAASIDGVQHVYNFIEVTKPLNRSSSSLQDTWLTSKIKGNIIRAAHMAPDQIVVVTENSTVYLLGIVTHEQAEEAVDIARHTAGVNHVVKIFKYITYSSS